MDDEKDFKPFINEPIFAVYKVKVQLELDESKAIRVIVNEMIDKFAGEFSINHNSVEVLSLDHKPNQDSDYMEIEFGAITDRDAGFEDTEKRIERMMKRELRYSNPEVTIIDLKNIKVLTKSNKL